MSLASNLVEDLMSTDLSTRNAAISQVLSMRNQQALEKVEDAIQRLTGKQNIDFYRPGGARGGSPKEAYDQILQIARDGKLSDDPALIQSLIPSVAFMNQDLMNELSRTDTKALVIYQLLGIQMQLKVQVG